MLDEHGQIVGVQGQDVVEQRLGLGVTAVVACSLDPLGEHVERPDVPWVELHRSSKMRDAGLEATLEAVENPL